MAKEYEFEMVTKSEIPQKAWGTGFWNRPTIIAFLEKLKDIPAGMALKLTFDTRAKALSAHQVLRHRIERATKLGLITKPYCITGRRAKTGEYHLFIYPDNNSKET